MTTNRRIRRSMGGIESKAGVVAVKAAMVPLGVSMANCPLFVAVPDKPGNEPEDIKKRILSSMADMQERASRPNIRDVFEICLGMQEN